MIFSPFQNDAMAFFPHLQQNICTVLENLEQQFTQSYASSHAPAVFQKKTWQRQEGGGGCMALMQNGALFEKAGVNTSTVFGNFSEAFCHNIPGASRNSQFWASGVSLVIHPRNPHVPAIHMNVRHIMTQKSWFGGGIDLNPALPCARETEFFHQELQNVCNQHDPNFYKRFRKWADDYFWISHRNVARGVGGIFYDYLPADEASWRFTRDIGELFPSLYVHLVQQKMHYPWTETERQAQLKYRGRYAEFNLLYDRGTTFGLKTGGNVDAILMSLPPHATWIE